MISNQITWLGVDTGGTFTDFVYFDGAGIRIHKVLSTPGAPEQAILQGMQEMGIPLDHLKLVHGSTVATNAVLESKGVKTLYITNRGFRDVMHIGRQARAELYNLQPEPRHFFIDKDDCLEIHCRLSAEGEELQPLDDGELQALVAQVEAKAPRSVAINCLFSFLNDRHEKQIAASLPDHLFVSCSSDVLPEYKEYERGMATCLNAYIGPLMAQYLRRLQDNIGEASLAVMQSAGGTMGAQQAGRHGVSLLLSGPAGGLKAARFAGLLNGRQRLLTFDMGGTSTDVALIDKQISLTSEGHIGPYPVPVPMVDMHTIGAGGGSIASLDEGGMLLVGPASAGADPGPACYGKGGRQPTVTDANLVLGRLPLSSSLGGYLQLDIEAARAALKTIAEPLGISIEAAAEGIVRIANEHMVAALRVISVQRGMDPAGFDLMSFGGAGGLHVCALARELKMARAIVPVHGGVLSALGMLVARPSRNLSRTMTRLLDDCDQAELEQACRELVERGLADMAGELSAAEGEVEWSLDCRYKGQSFSLNLPWQALGDISEAFHELHESRYGHRLDMPVELVNIRVQIQGPGVDFSLPELPPVKAADQGRLSRVPVYGLGMVDVYQREQLGAGQHLQGPLLIVEKNATTFVEAGWQCEVADCGNLLLAFAGS